MHKPQAPGSREPLEQTDTAPVSARVGQHEIPHIYGRIAPVYDLWASLTESRTRRMVIDAARISDGERILEVAVGTGGLFAELVRRNPSGVTDGVDLTSAMLARAKTKVAHLPGRHRLDVGDAHNLSAEDESYDVVVNSYMFDLLPEGDFAPVLAEFFRVLRPGGRLVLANMAVAERWHSHIWNVLYRLRPSLLGGCRGVRMTPYVCDAGFEQVTRRYVTQMSFPSEVMTALRPVPRPGG